MKGLGLENLLRNFISNFLRQIGTGLLGLITTAFIARTYGPEGNGRFAIALLLPGILTTFLNLGMGPANVYYLGSNQVSVRKLLRVNMQIYLFLTIIGVLTGVLAIIWRKNSWFPGVESIVLWLALAAFPLSLLHSFLSSIFQGLQQFHKFNFILLAQPLTFLILMLISTFLGINGIAVLVIIHLFALFTVILVTVWQLFEHLDLGSQIQDKSYFKQSLGYGGKAHLSNVLTYISYKSDIFLVNFFLGSTLTGLYVVSVSIAEKLWLISQSVSIVLLPRLSQLSSDEAVRKQLTPLMSRCVFIVTLFLGTLLTFFAHWFIKIVFGDTYLPAKVPLLILIPGMVFFATSRVLANDIAARGRPDLNVYTSILTVFTNLLGSLLIIPIYGLNGAAMVTTVAYGLDLAARLIMYGRITNIHWTHSVLPRVSDFQILFRNFR